MMILVMPNQDATTAQPRPMITQPTNVATCGLTPFSSSSSRGTLPMIATTPDIITTVPNVSYFATDIKEKRFIVHQPTELPDPNHLLKVEEPYIYAQVITKPDYIGNIMTLCLEKRGMLIKQNYLTPTRLEMIFHMPLAEIVFDFYDKLKSLTRGYASFDYHIIDFRETDLVKLDIKLNGEQVDALSALVHRTKAEYIGRRMCEKLKDLLPRQQFQIAIQASIGQKVIARETISALRKDVTAKCYGGDMGVSVGGGNVEVTRAGLG